LSGKGKEGGKMIDMTDKQFDFLMVTLEGRILDRLKSCKTVEEAMEKVKEAFTEAKENDLR